MIKQYLEGRTSNCNQPHVMYPLVKIFVYFAKQINNADDFQELNQWLVLILKDIKIKINELLQNIVLENNEILKNILRC